MPENQFALDMYHRIKAFGAETVFQLIDLELSKIEADDLLEKMMLIENIRAEIQREIDEASQ